MPSLPKKKLPQETQRIRPQTLELKSIFSIFSFKKKKKKYIISFPPPHTISRPLISERKEFIFIFIFIINLFHGFKNRTGPVGPTGSTGNRPLIRSGYDKKPEIY